MMQGHYYDAEYSREIIMVQGQYYDAQCSRDIIMMQNVAGTLI